MADEFAANLDRTLAKVVSFNLRKLATGQLLGMLLATTHDDLIEDLQPDLHVRCRGDGEIETDRHCHRGESRAVSFASELAVEDGSLATGRGSRSGTTGAIASVSSDVSLC